MAVILVLLLLGWGHRVIGKNHSIDTPPLIGFLCDDPDSVAFYSLNSIGDCQPPKVVNSGTNRTIQVLMDPNYDSVPVKSCSVLAHFTLTLCFAHGHSSFLKAYDKVIEISRDECSKMTDSGEFVFYNRTIKFPVNTSFPYMIYIQGARSDNGDCTGGRFLDDVHNRVYDKVIVLVNLKIQTKSYRAKVDLSSGNLILASGATCSFSDPLGHCYDIFEGDTYFDRATPLPRCDRSLFQVLYSRPATVISSQASPNQPFKTYAVVDTPDKAFAILLAEEYRSCGFSFRSTEYPNLHVLLDVEFFKSPETSVTPDTLIFYLSKLLYQEFRTRTSLEQLHIHSLQRRCLLERDLFKTKLAILQSYPAAAAHLLFPDPLGKHGLVRGEALLASTCTKEVVYFRATSDRHCWDRLPITYGANISAFLSPVTHVIVDSASPVHCSKLAPVLFQVQTEVWVSLDPTHSLLQVNPVVLQPFHHFLLRKLRPLVPIAFFRIKKFRNFLGL